MMTFKLADGRMIRVRQRELTKDPTVTLLSPAGDWQNYKYHMWTREAEITIPADKMAAWLMEQLGRPLDSSEEDTLSLDSTQKSP